MYAKEQNRIAASSSKNHKWLSKTNWSAIQNGGTQSHMLHSLQMNLRIPKLTNQ